MKELFLWISKLNNNFWLRVSKSTNEDVRSLCVYRIIAGLSLLTINYKNISWIGYSPKIFFNPPVLSIASFFNGFPSANFFVAMELLLILLSLFITVGIKTRISSFLYIIVSVITLNFKYSLGKIDHEIMQYVLLFCMSFSGWGHYLAVVPDKIATTDSTKKSLSLLSVMVCFAFFSAGFEKAVGWINFDVNSNGSGNWFYVGYYILERQYLLAPFFKYMPFGGFKIMDFVAVLFELSPLFFLLTSKKAWRIWLIIACSFHLANTLILNINFIGISIIYLAFVDYSALFSKIKYLASFTFTKIAAFCGLSLIAVYRIKNCLSAGSINRSSADDDLYIGYLYFGIILWILIIALIYKNAFRKTHYQIQAEN